MLDICWLKSVQSNTGLEITHDFMEDTINELEQQCQHNIKTQHVGIEYDDHVVCDVCQSPNGEDGNEMVFCDHCNICVHQACYGIIEIPEGDWLCSPCKDMQCKYSCCSCFCFPQLKLFIVSGSKKKAVCVFCCNVGGALKPTTKPNQWAHVSCAHWIPEAFFVNTDLLEPIDLKKVPNWRWNLVCSLCSVKKGAPITCDVC